MDVPGIALITGAGSGIGRACAQLFAKEGSTGLALIDLSQASLEATKASIHASVPNPPKITLYAVDITSEPAITTTITSAAQEFNRLDYIINAAGISIKHPGGVGHATTDSWNKVLSVNLTGTFFVLRAAAKIMLAQAPLSSAIDGRVLCRGSIVNFSSIQGYAGIAGSAAYTASKHGVIGLTRTASEDYAKDGIRVNAVCPGYTETPMTMDDPLVREAMRVRVAGAVPMGRMGRAEEIADAVVFLAGGRSSFVTGTTLCVDGGFLQR
ncbi:hypothetical protein BDV25DRAFT_170345 [Aspergillus avenaceus]|uniref:NAD(P)-binding protein n=1 Tax=Aspergillus avenaceus TaxID=36643 RepID=A0A5N6U8T4_ASPAV|nr:hypothetical protein BDV25DRAFT_170345 [Aspergillus avenaceus]